MKRILLYTNLEISFAQQYLLELMNLNSKQQYMIKLIIQDKINTI